MEVATNRADIVYRYRDSKEEIDELDHWKVYTKPVEEMKGKYLHVNASRIGYADSQTIIIK